MSNEIAVRTPQEIAESYTAPAAVEAVGGDYRVNIGAKTLFLKREVDFGKIPGTKKPTLYKSGAERIVMAYGLRTDFDLLSAVERDDTDNPYFSYMFRCRFSAVLPDGRDIHITDGYGSANTRERKCGRASAYDVQNTQLKIAKKRALVDGALLIGQLSNMFGQDIENEDFMSDAETKVGKVLSDTDAITPAQTKRIYALAAANGVSTKQAKAIIKEAGFESAKEITQGAYDAICRLISGEEAAE